MAWQKVQNDTGFTWQDENGNPWEQSGEPPVEQTKAYQDEQAALNAPKMAASYTDPGAYLGDLATVYPIANQMMLGAPKDGTTLETELAKYNSLDPTIDPYWATKILGYKDYFKTEGGWEPGGKNANVAVAQQADAQWAKDGAPGPLENVVKLGILAAGVAAGGAAMGLWDLSGAAAATGATASNAAPVAANIGTGSAASSGGSLLSSSYVPAMTPLNIPTALSVPSLTGVQTGGMFVGSSGLVGSTGSALADGALNGVAKGAITSMITGGDPLKGGIAGAIGGGFASFLPPGVTDTGKAINAAASGAVSGGVNAALNGGDVGKGILGGGVGGGVGGYVGSITEDLGKATSGALSGAAGAGAGALVTGGDVGNAVLRGGVVGGVSGLVNDAIGGKTGAIVGPLAGAVAGTFIAPPSKKSVGSNPTQVTNTANDLGFSFGSTLPQYNPITRAAIDWSAQRLPGR